jgi:hypothetical protein
MFVSFSSMAGCSLFIFQKAKPKDRVSLASERDNPDHVHVNADYVWCKTAQEDCLFELQDVSMVATANGGAGKNAHRQVWGEVSPV